MTKNHKQPLFKNIWRNIKATFGITENVYFVSGMCYNCSVFDNIELPKGYKKVYLEWKMPELNETLEKYVKRMSRKIDKKKKIILVGYSLGGIVVQEMAQFLKPEKIILISTMKDEQEIPELFHIAQKVNFADNIPMRLYSSSNFMINLFNRYVYNLPTTALTDFMTVVDPVYIRWALRQITHWTPKKKKLKNLYHIHGTKDQVFPFEQIVDPISVKGGDHLMVIKRPKEMGLLIKDILNQPLEK